MDDSQLVHTLAQIFFNGNVELMSDKTDDELQRLLHVKENQTRALLARNATTPSPPSTSPSVLTVDDESVCCYCTKDTCGMLAIGLLLLFGVPAVTFGIVACSQCCCFQASAIACYGQSCFDCCCDYGYGSCC